MHPAPIGYKRPLLIEDGSPDKAFAAQSPDFIQIALRLLSGAESDLRMICGRRKLWLCRPQRRLRGLLKEQAFEFRQDEYS